jgi:hypothetical protein
MEADRFDRLTRHLTGLRLTRAAALRGLVAGTVVVSGVVAAPPAAAKKRKTICHCDNPSATCSTERVSKRQARRHLRDDQCDYLGECRTTLSGTTNPCASAGSDITVDTTLLGQPCTAGGNECGTSATTGLTCVANVCVPTDVANSTICTTNSDCTSGRCNTTTGICVSCPETSICGAAGSEQCCAVDANCVNNNVCVFPVSSG